MSFTPKVRKLVIPASGSDTRFLPATKVLPKELMSIGAKPLIQFAVEEASASGIEMVILVLSSGKALLAEHFRPNPHLEGILASRGMTRDLELIHRLSELAEIRTVWQEPPLGLADAIRCAGALVGEEPFAVAIPDALIDARIPCTAQLLACYEKHAGCVIATRLVDRSEVSRFGILDTISMPDPCCGGRSLRVVALADRPEPEATSSRHGIFGRYILQPEIFPCIEQTRPGRGGKLQLTDSLSLCAERTPVYAYEFEGTHYDAGDRFAFLQATLAYSLNDPELSGPLRHHLAALQLPATTSASRPQSD
jgi:UTP--glucose-1-phosphate uridylyltransferase